MRPTPPGQLLAGLLALITALAGCHRAGTVPAKAPAPTPAWQLASVTSAIEEPGDDPARLVPADARVYLRLDGLGDLSKLAEEDPLAGQVQATLRHLQPPELWKRAATNLQMDDETLLRTYFGTTVAVVDQKVDGRHAVVVLSRAPPEDLERLPRALGMVPWPTTRRIGPFSIWSTPAEDHPLLLAVGKRWLAITERRQAPHLCHLLCGVAEDRNEATTPAALAETTGFRDLVDALPGPREALLFTQDRRGRERHALGVVRDQDRIVAHYRAVVPKLAEVAERFRWAPSLDFGPLPASVLSATAVHVLD
ncbi:MAG: hypothetical protein OER86_13740, partial [Phycisphaerae bacterium]|nr:hypothetical protein [Phycisphaerae bacterium]